ncbi:MAG TPA: O-antigen ligase family protein [Ktedonobacterales bacterium]
MSQVEAMPDAVPAVASDGVASAALPLLPPRRAALVWLDTRWERWGGSLAAGLALAVQWFFLLILLALPLDAYLTLPARGSGIFLSQLLIIETVGLLVLALAAGWLARRETSLRLRWADLLPLGLVVLAALLSVVGATSRSTAFRESLKVAVLLGLYLLARGLRAVPGIRFRALAAILGGFVMVVVLGLLQTRPGVADISGLLLNIQRSAAGLPASGIIRAEATFRYPNELAAYLLLVLPLLAAAVVRIPWHFERVALAVLLLLGLWLLFATYTRGALIAVLVVAPFMLYALGGRRWAVIGGIVAAVFVGYEVLRGGASASRLLSLVSPSDTGYTTRLAAWRWALGAFFHRPLTGVGLGNLALQPGAPFIDPVNHIREVDAENLLLNVLAELGVLGLAAVGYCLVGAARRAWAGLRAALRRESDDWADQAWNIGAFVALGAVLVYGIGDPVLVSGQVVGVLCVLVALAGPPQPARDFATPAVAPAVAAEAPAVLAIAETAPAMPAVAPATAEIAPTAPTMPAVETIEVVDAVEAAPIAFITTITTITGPDGSTETEIVATEPIPPADAPAGES